MVARRHHLVGEDAPRWLVAGIGVLGATVVGAGAWALTARGDAGDGSAAATPVVAGVTVVPPTTTTAAATTSTVAVTATTATATTVAPTTSSTTSSTTAAPATIATSAPAAGPPTTLDPVAAGLCPAPVTVLFEFGMTHPLAAPDDAGLAAVAAWTTANPIGRVVVTGHASSIGLDVDNLLLSFDRATAVANLLRSIGVNDGQIAVRAAGELDPLPFEDPESAANQRVVIRGDAAICPEVP